MPRRGRACLPSTGLGNPHSRMTKSGRKRRQADTLAAERCGLEGGRGVGSGPMARCRNCGSAGLSTLYDFGQLPLGGYLAPTPSMARQAPRFVNALAICGACGLVQQAFDGAREALIELVYSNYQPTYSMSAAVRAY